MDSYPPNCLFHIHLLFIFRPSFHRTFSEMKFVIITPIRNEAKHIPTALSCMFNQTFPPVEWILVNDGSTDDTEREILKVLSDHPFINYVPLPDRGFRKPGAGVIEAFYEGYRRIRTQDYDILAKFDGDMEFPPDTLEVLAERFRSDPKLGIAGGTLYERPEGGGSFRRAIVAKGFVRGATKFYRRRCFQDIQGLIERSGWDGVDIIRANMKGWRTEEIESMKILHLKPTGTAKGEGLRKACEKYGDVSHYMGGYFWYFLLRVLGRSLEGRNPRIGYYMLKGYLRSKRSGLPTESEAFRHQVKAKQTENVAHQIKRLLRITSL